MVNNFTNINKMNNHFSPQIIENKNSTIYDRNPGSGLGQAQKCDMYFYGQAKLTNELSSLF